MNHRPLAPRPSRHLFLVTLLLGMLAAALPALADKNDAIVISSTAIPQYVRAVDANGKPRPETYAFTEGVHLQGDTRDRSEERMTFEEITRTLASSLAKQSYFPASDAASANLLIRVYWGTTKIFDDPEREQNIERLSTARANMQTAADAGTPIDLIAMNSALNDSANANNSTAAAVERNARLLGYKLSLLKEEKNTMASAREQSMRAELAEERYFVVLMAYDFQFQRREKKSKLLWVTRLSIRGPGNNFTEALPALATAGSAIFGQNLADMKRIKVRDLPGGTVKLHDLKVLGTADTTPPEAKTGK
jgi:hypothetical protein